MQKKEIQELLSAACEAEELYSLDELEKYTNVDTNQGLNLKYTLTPDFWDCECQQHFIHYKEINKCNQCGAERENQPDSNVSEILNLIQLGFISRQGK